MNNVCEITYFKYFNTKRKWVFFCSLLKIAQDETHEEKWWGVYKLLWSRPIWHTVYKNYISWLMSQY